MGVAQRAAEIAGEDPPRTARDPRSQYAADTRRSLAIRERTCDHIRRGTLPGPRSDQEPCRRGVCQASAAHRAPEPTRTVIRWSARPLRTAIGRRTSCLQVPTTAHSASRSAHSHRLLATSSVFLPSSISVTYFAVLPMTAKKRPDPRALARRLAGGPTPTATASRPNCPPAMVDAVAAALEHATA